jgi:hypothetical protein
VQVHAAFVCSRQSWRKAVEMLILKTLVNILWLTSVFKNKVLLKWPFPTKVVA